MGGSRGQTLYGLAIVRHYASIIGKIFGIIWKVFRPMQIFCKNLRVSDLLRMNGSQVMA